MNGHEETRRLLALAAAGDLDDAERRKVEAHAAECDACARELRVWRELTGALGRIPTPLAPAALVERTHLMVAEQAVTTDEARAEAAAMVWIAALAWAFAASVWAIAGALGYAPDARTVVIWFVTWIALSALASGAAAALLAARRRAWRAL